MRDIDKVVDLMRASDRHRNWAIREIDRLIVPPLLCGQYRIFKDPDAYVSWAYLTDDARDGYIGATRKLQPGDWTAGSELWMMDFICPYGGVGKIVREICTIFPPGSTAKIWRRAKKKIGYINNAVR